MRGRRSELIHMTRFSKCRELPNRGGREELYYAVQVGSQQKNCLSSRFSPISLTAKVSWFGAGSRQAMQELMLEQEYRLSGTVNRFCAIKHPVLAVLGRSPQASLEQGGTVGYGSDEAMCFRGELPSQMRGGISPCSSTGSVEPPCSRFAGEVSVLRSVGHPVLESM